MSSLFEKRNTAVATNYRGPTNSIVINEAGSDWYWAVFSVMAASAIVFSVMAAMTPRGERVFHYLTIAIVSVASVAYFTMAADLGSVAIISEFANYSSLPTRQVFYARYIDWVITTPLLLTDLMLLAGLPWSTIIFTIVMDEVMVLTGLFGAITPSSYKWGYFTFGMVAYFFVAWVLIVEARKNAHRLGSDVHRLYIGIAIWTATLWTLYPVAWGLSEGGNVTSSDGEAIFYGVLDLLAKPVFGLWILLGHKGIGMDRLGLVEGRNYLGEGTTGTQREKDVVLGDRHHRDVEANHTHNHHNTTTTTNTTPTTTSTTAAAPVSNNVPTGRVAPPIVESAHRTA
ncbi:Opsin-1 [Taphrina deformans PYCC 5710]|uniref:Opsin-1 n=1 Tax=Taphrina deformans (strain PYCC 5710 / ATCC 11124 / CBS 356.35 / IMI 108563 / JCM 9778 / NBRC 8474) TaxID=1097556 RepID=R4X8C7_TAPDE|nr:Opsin-1 [Taphrina deformans PYCC 5710]|eukprot:CCG81813.1 Opsin-1 [Taphrina deformans PYCC 5710]